MYRKQNQLILHLVESVVDQPKSVSLWRASLPARKPEPRLEGSHLADVAIIGGGYTGCAAALALAERGANVCLLESEEIGAGASGRSGGQVNPGLKFEPTQLESIYGPRKGPQVVAAVGSVADEVFGLIERHAISCDAVRTGWVLPAPTHRALKLAENRVREWRARGADARMLDKAQVAALLGTDKAYYRGGLIDMRGGNINPLAYVRGLADAACKAGAKLHAASPVTSLKLSGHQWTLDTPHGRVVADKVLICTNGYTGKTLWPNLAQSVVTVKSFQAATAVLPDRLAKSILPGRQSVSDLRRLMWYYRIGQDNRLIMGGRAPFRNTLRPADLRPLKNAIAHLYPQLAEWPIEFYWSGKVAMTQDHLPHLHELAPGMWTGLGYNGRGIAMGTFFGGLLARLAAGEPADDLPFPIVPLNPIPGHVFSRLGARTLIQYYRMRDQIDGWLA